MSCFLSGFRADVEHPALATRMAQIFKLGDKNEGDDDISREVKRRIWWTCFIVDTTQVLGLNRTRLHFQIRQKQYEIGI
jgi:hypothetical protein